MDQFWMDLNGGFVWGLKSFFEGFWEYFEELEELYCQGLQQALPRIMDASLGIASMIMDDYG